MSFQVPGNMLITGCMMTFYRSTPAVIFWQLANQSFNSLVNYTNRNASAGTSPRQKNQKKLDYERNPVVPTNRPFVTSLKCSSILADND